MKAETVQQKYYLLALLARTAVFVLLTMFALRTPPERFDRVLRGGLSPLSAVWLLLMLSMLLRLLPSRVETVGCLKVFRRRYRPSGRTPAAEEIRRADRGALRVLAAWAAANAVFFLLYARHMVGRRFLVCLAAFYGVCDLICVLVFCPFRAWMMHNRCCTTCRIYDWDYLMLCTPLLPVGGWMAVSACAASAVLFLRWEITWRLHPERFLESSNEALRCAGCREHLCTYRRALGRRLRRAGASCGGTEPDGNRED